ncbi:trypsin-like serine protease [Allochromatium palmeri]|nr:trypsin-like serine protease [Allochromatium palmeri]
MSFWLAIGFALVASPAWALINGQFDDEGRYGAVVALWSEGERRCSATKIDSNTFLTAAHCVVDVARGKLSSPFQPGGTLLISARPESRPSDTQALVVANTELPPAFAAGLQRLYDYQQSRIEEYRARYNGEDLARRIRRVQADSRITDRFPDAALVRVVTPTPAIPQLPVSLAPLPAGADVILVGYGCERVSDWRRSDRRDRPARRLWGRSQVIRVDGVNFYTFGSERRAGSATLCPGDSGGPVLLDGRVVGVHGTVWGLSHRDTARSNMSVNLHGLIDWKAWIPLASF